MVSAGSGNSGLINGDNGTVGVSDKAVESSGVSSSVDSGGSGSGVKSSSNSLGGQVIGTGSGNSGLINGNNSAIGVSDELGVQVEGAGIAVGNSGSSSSDGGGGDHGSSGVGDGGNGGGSGVAEGRGVGISLSLDGKVISTGGGHSGLINGDNSAVRVSDQLGVEVEGASIAVGGSVARVSSIGHGGSVVAGVGDSRGSSNGGASIAVTHSGGSSIAVTHSGGGSVANRGDSSLESQVVGTGSGNCGLINRDNSAVREGLESIEALGGSGGNASGENLK